MEDMSLLELARSNNKLLNKLLVSIATLCEEIHLLVNEAKDNYYTPLVSYDEGKLSKYITSVIRNPL